MFLFQHANAPRHIRLLWVDSKSKPMWINVWGIFSGDKGEPSVSFLSWRVPAAAFPRRTDWGFQECLALNSNWLFGRTLGPPKESVGVVKFLCESHDFISKPVQPSTSGARLRAAAWLLENAVVFVLAATGREKKRRILSWVDQRDKNIAGGRRGSERVRKRKEEPSYKKRRREKGLVCEHFERTPLSRWAVSSWSCGSALCVTMYVCVCIFPLSSAVLVDLCCLNYPD